MNDIQNKIFHLEAIAGFASSMSTACDLLTEYRNDVAFAAAYRGNKGFNSASVEKKLNASKARVLNCVGGARNYLSVMEDGATKRALTEEYNTFLAILDGINK